jgi:hypothetical protein
MGFGIIEISEMKYDLSTRVSIHAQNYTLFPLKKEEILGLFDNFNFRPNSI